MNNINNNNNKNTQKKIYTMCGSDQNKKNKEKVEICLVTRFRKNRTVQMVVPVGRRSDRSRPLTGDGWEDGVSLRRCVPRSGS
jgi:hypothetical protein